MTRDDPRRLPAWMTWAHLARACGLIIILSVLWLVLSGRPYDAAVVQMLLAISAGLLGFVGFLGWRNGNGQSRRDEDRP